MPIGFGAVLAGLAFAGSGYIACQLKHLGIVSTIVWLPVGLLLIDRALCGRVPTTTRARRAFFMAAFGLVFAEQVLCGFPQSAYICALVYGSFALFRAVTDREGLGPLPVRVALLGGVGVAALLGAAAGAVVLLPLSELGSVSDRAEPLGWAWSTRIAYWPPNILTFLLPYVHGDVSDNTYVGHSIFWEDYGYVGGATFLLALYGGMRERRRPVVAFSILMTLVAVLARAGAGDAGVSRGLLARSRAEAVSLPYAVPDRRGAGPRAPWRRWTDTPRRGPGARSSRHRLVCLA